MATLACQITSLPYLRGIYHEESVQSLVLEEFLQGFLGVLVGDFAEDVRWELLLSVLLRFRGLWLSLFAVIVESRRFESPVNHLYVGFPSFVAIVDEVLQ
jgi:hypothetical protein